jgi:hypothetical protein
MPTYAVLDADDFDRIKAGGHSLRWNLNASDKEDTYAYVRLHIPGTGKRMVSHLVALPPKGRRVRHHDGNPLNLRRANLYIAGRGRTKGDVRPAEQFRLDFATTNASHNGATAL